MMVGSVMLVLITMIAAVLLYLWFTGYQSRVQTGAASINLLPAASITEATLMINNHTSVTLSVENVGDTSIYITEASILTINGETICTATPSGDGNGEASPPSKLNETVVGNILIASFTCSQPPI